MRLVLSGLPVDAGTAVVEPTFTGVEVEVPRTPFVDANQQTILTRKDSNRIGLGDFTRDDGTSLMSNGML